MAAVQHPPHILHHTSSDSSSGNPGPPNQGSSVTGFPRSGLGTPDFFYSFGDGAGQTPSWFKPADRNNVNSGSVNYGGPAHAAAASSASSSSRQPNHQPQQQRQMPPQPESDEDDNNANGVSRDAGAAKSDEHLNEEPSTRTRALSDPPIRQTPTWFTTSNPAHNANIPGNPALANAAPLQTVQKLKQLEAEPNPFERSFSGKQPYEQVSLITRRARSISPQGSPSLGGPSTGMGASVNPVNPLSIAAKQQLPSFGAFNTPSADLGGFGWALPNDQSLRAGPLSPSMLNGPAYGNIGTPNRAGNLSGLGLGKTSDFADGGMFDPTSIKTGLTPGGLGMGMGIGGGVGGNQYPPHSPATQALFAMMTNSTPGLPALHKLEDRFDENTYQTHSNNAAFGGAPSLGPPHNDRRSVSNSSSGHSHSQSPVHSHNSGNGISGGNNQLANPVPMYSQSIPRPLPPQSYGASRATTGPVGPSLHGPPLPGRGAVSSSNIPSHLMSQQAIPRGQPIQPSNPRQGASGNPLFLLSQAHAALGNPLELQPGSSTTNNNPSSMAGTAVGGADDAVLAAAAGLSGLSTPRSAYVGGPRPVGPGGVDTVAPTNLNMATHSNLALPQNIGPGNNNNNQISYNAADGRSGSNAGLAPGKDGKKKTDNAGVAAKPAGEPPATAGTKRKAAGRQSSQQTAKPEAKKPKRRVSARRAAASAQAAAEDDGPDEDDYNDIKDEDMDDSRSMNGSIISGNGGNSIRGASVKYDFDNESSGNYGGQGEFGGSDDGSGGDGRSQSPSKNGGGGGSGGRSGKQQFQTEEEKRKNFLERNRQAALKCRQRKKQWLQQLQTRVESLSSENESLQGTVHQLREEINGLRNVLMNHKDCPMGLQAPPGQPAFPAGMQGQTIGNILTTHPQYQQQHPQGRR